MSKREKICLGILLLAAFIMRIIFAIRIGDFSWDEFFSITFSQKNWGASWHYWLLETNGPLHMIILKFWFWFFPINHLFARMPSIIFGTLSVWFLYNFLNKNFSDLVAWLGAIILAFDVPQLFFSATVRGYSFLNLLSVLSLIVFYDNFINQTKKENIKLPIINLLGILTHLTFALLIISQLAYLISKDIKLFKLYIKNNLPVGFMAAGWYICSALAKTSLKKFGTSWFLNIIPSWGNFFSVTDSLGLYYKSISSALLVISMIVGIILVTKKYLKEKDWDKFYKIYFLVIFWFLTMIFMLFTGIVNFKFYIICLPAFCSILAINISHIKVRPILLYILTFTLCVPSLFLYLLAIPLKDWTVIRPAISATKTDDKKRLLILADFYSLLDINQYVDPNIKIKGFRITDETKEQIEKRIVLENYLYYKHDATEIDSWLKKEVLPENYTDLFIIQQRVDYGGVDMTGRLEHFGYKIRDAWNLDSSTNLYWYENTTTTKK